MRASKENFERAEPLPIVPHGLAGTDADQSHSVVWYAVRGVFAVRRKREELRARRLPDRLRLGPVDAPNFCAAIAD